MLRRLDSFVCIVAIYSSSCGSGSTPASPSSSTTAAPTVTAIVPANGSTQGGTTVTITGTHFAAGAVVTIGGDPAGNVQVVDAAHITARTSPHAAGVADVAVRVAATAGTLPGAFTFLAPGSTPLTSLELAIDQDYQQVFRAQITHPAFFDNSACGGSTVSTTAYLKQSGTSSTLLYVSTSADGKTVLNQLRRTVVTPAGMFRVLVVLVGYAETVNQSNAGSFAPAQDQINQDHTGFAASKGYSAPIVSFQNTNEVIDHSEIADPRTPNGVTAALTQHGVSTSGYDFLVSVNIDPAALEGGFSAIGTQPAFIYMGNYRGWKSSLTPGDFTSISQAVYHHEVAHHWGWAATHDWATCYPIGPFHFIVPPVLFGWEDTNGNGVPEILDSAPY